MRCVQRYLLVAFNLLKYYLNLLLIKDSVLVGKGFYLKLFLL